MDGSPQNQTLPGESPYYRLTNFSFLLGVAEEMAIPAITRKSLRHLLDILEPPDQLYRLFLVLNNLKDIYPILKIISRDQRWRLVGDRICSTEKACTILVEHRQDILSRRGLHKDLEAKYTENGKSSNNDSFRGLNKDHPLWCALGHQPIGGRLFPFHQLLSHILLCTVTMENHPAAGRLNNDRNKALTAVRGLANSKNIKELNALPESLLSPEKYCQGLRDLPEDFRLHEVATFLEEVIDFVGMDWQEEPVTEHPEELHKEIRFLEMPAADEKCSPDSQIVVPAGFEILTGRAGAGYWSGTQISKSLAKANQLFPFAWNTLSRTDIVSLIDFLDPEQTSLKPASVQARAFLSLMLWCGMDEARIAGICLKYGFHAEGGHPGRDLYNPQSGTMRLISEFPVLKTPVPVQARDQLHERQFYMDIPLPEMAVKALTHYLTRQPADDGTKLFPLTPIDIRTSCLKECRVLGGSNRAHLSLVRIQSLLQNRLARTSYGDSASAVLAFGKDIFLGRSKAHYASFGASDLKEIYRRTVHDILQQTGRQPVFSPQYPAATTLHVGTPKRPRLRTVQDLFARLIDTLSLLRSSIKTTEDLAAYHNLYTTYTVMAVFFATGRRPTRSPYIPAEDIDTETGFCIIRDKDTPDYYHTRLVWLPRVMQDQLKHYRIYLKNLLGHTGPGAGQKGEGPGFFYLDKNLQAEQVRPQTLAGRLQDLGYHAPVNAQRHFLKSELQEAGCAADVVELFLGHWEVGEEGFTRSSALFPADYRAELERHLTPLLKRIGIIPQRGLISLPRRFRAMEITFARRATAPRPRQPIESEWVPGKPPGEIWFQVLAPLRREMDFCQAFNAEQKAVLRLMTEKLPALYAGEEDLSLSQAEIRTFYFRLGRRGVDKKTAFRRQLFFCLGLEHGRAKHQWDVRVPPPKILPKDKNLVRPSIGPALTDFRRIEKAFVRDLEQPLPDRPELRVGQILVSAILYGGLHHKNWLENFTLALAGSIYQWRDWLWLDLWTDRKYFEASFESRFFAQMKPGLYRRWVADPTTQALIYRWYHFAPEDRKVCAELEPEKVLAGYLSHIGISLKRKRKLLNALFEVASAFAVITLPPFLTAYAKNQLPSASLPGPRWIRFLDDRIVPVTRPSRERDLPDPLPDRAFLKSAQNDLRKKLCRLLPAQRPENESDLEKVAGRIRSFMERKSGKVSPVLFLLGEWAIYLFSHKTSELDRHREKDSLQPSTVENYITSIADPLFAVYRGSNPLQQDEEDFQGSCKRIGAYYRHKHQVSFGAAAYVHTINRLRLFHDFLEICYNAPDVSFAGLLKRGARGRSDRVSANIFSPGDYLRISRALGWDAPAHTRQQKMTLCALVLAYRLGLRRSEILGLRLMDLIGHDHLDVLVQPHADRGLKSASARRLMPLDLLAPSEVSFIRSWLEERAEEPCTNENSFLFTSSSLSSEMISDRELFSNLRRCVKEITGDDYAVLHHFRHSFDTNLVLHLMRRGDIKLSATPEMMEDNSGAFTLHPDLLDAIIGNEFSGRKKLHATAIMMGHADVPTGLYSYVHLSDFLLGYYCRHRDRAPKFSPAAVANILGISAKRGQQIVRGPGHPLISSLAANSVIFKEMFEHPLMREAAAPALPHKARAREGLLLPLDEVLAELRRDLKQEEGGIKLPQGLDELEWLRRKYESIERLQFRAQKRLIGIAARLKSCCRNNYLEFDRFIKAREFLDLWQACGADLDELKFSCHGSRWYKKDQQDKGGLSWRKKFPMLQIHWKGEGQCQLKNSYGCLRASIENEKNMTHVIKCLLQCLCRASRR